MAFAAEGGKAWFSLTPLRVVFFNTRKGVFFLGLDLYLCLSLWLRFVLRNALHFVLRFVLRF